MNSEIRYLAQQLLHAGLGPSMRARPARDCACCQARAHGGQRQPPLRAESHFRRRLADKVAVLGGLWSFIVGFCAFLIAWAFVNAVVLVEWAFDPYPFIFLNLLLSMLAALQAPVIMMSQNRQAAKDRLAASLDYEVNVKAK